MLISHRFEFIFIKTVKTAGTSVESYFEPYCMFDNEWEQKHARNEYISEAGIIGCRAQRHREKGTKRQVLKPKYRSHMPAKTIKERVGDDIWNRYFKFTVIRNPFDKLVSKFLFMELKRNQYYGKVHLLTNKMKNIIQLRKSPFENAKGATEIERFRSWLKNGARPIDRDKYMIDSEVCVDYFIQFENLYEDMKYVCENLSIPFEPARLPEFKKGHRNNEIPFRDFYDRETENIVRELYDWEIKRFGYDLPN